MRTFIFILFWLVVGCTKAEGGYSWVYPADQDPGAVKYDSEDGFRYIFSFQYSALYGSYTGNQLAKKIRSGADTMGTSWRMWDCSSDDFACLRTQHYVFAVPRRGISSHQAYFVEGQRFNAISCQDDLCHTVKIKVTCERTENNMCVSKKSKADKYYVSAYFIFDRSKGVIAIEFNPDQRNRSKNLNVLVSPLGILADRGVP